MICSDFLIDTFVIDYMIMQACWEIEYHIAKVLIYKHEICTMCKLFLSFSMSYLSEYKTYNCVFVALSVFTEMLFITFLLSALLMCNKCYIFDNRFSNGRSPDKLNTTICNMIANI